MTNLDELAVVVKAKRDKNVHEVALTIEQRDAVAGFICAILGGSIKCHPDPVDLTLRKRKKAKVTA